MTDDIIQIITPDRAENEYPLVLVTKLLYVAKGLEHQGGILGGEWGYGVEYENDTFMMHPYCWCERGDCLWCCSCECEGHWDTGDGSYHGPDHDWIVTKQCDNCREDRTSAPNFHYKPTDYKVWWYKWIGRGEKTDGHMPDDMLEKITEFIRLDK